MGGESLLNLLIGARDRDLLYQLLPALGRGGRLGTHTQRTSGAEVLSALSRGSRANRLGDGLRSRATSVGGGPLASLGMSIFRLFGGGRREPEEPVIERRRFQAPDPVRIDAGYSQRGGGAVDFDQYGRPRIGQPTGGPMNVTVQVQAMDSRSFLDHREDIAKAVRQAMLESSTLQDVIWE